MVGMCAKAGGRGPGIGFEARGRRLKLIRLASDTDGETGSSDIPSRGQVLQWRKERVSQEAKRGPLCVF